MGIIESPQNLTVHGEIVMGEIQQAVKPKQNS